MNNSSVYMCLSDGGSGSGDGGKHILMFTDVDVHMIPNVEVTLVSASLQTTKAQVVAKRFRNVGTASLAQSVTKTQRICC